MALSEPEPGLVISYSYLWHHERVGGEEEGRKDRPCVIVLVAARVSDGATVVTVVPVTHRPPDDSAFSLEIPQAVKKHFGLDAERSWVIINEGNRFAWPGYDLRKLPRNPARYDYGFLPPQYFIPS